MSVLHNPKAVLLIYSALLLFPDLSIRKVNISNYEAIGELGVYVLDIINSYDHKDR